MAESADCVLFLSSEADLPCLLLILLELLRALCSLDGTIGRTQSVKR
jgi:hypothetical protein